jgi:hypothetical protein
VATTGEGVDADMERDADGCKKKKKGAGTHNQHNNNKLICDRMQSRRVPGTGDGDDDRRVIPSCIGFKPNLLFSAYVSVAILREEEIKRERKWKWK